VGKLPLVFCKCLKKLAGTTRLELATSAVTGRYFHDNSKT
jgi:hypothetical protein